MPGLNSKSSRAGGRQARASRGLRLVGLFVVLFAIVVFALTRLAPQPQLATTSLAASAMVVDPRRYDLRLSGSPEMGDALAPALVEAWLVSRGAESVDVSQRKAGAAPLPERVVSARIAEHTLRIDIRASGDKAGLSDLANGRTDIAMFAQPMQRPKPSATVEIGVTTARSGPPQRIILVPAAAETPAAKAFIAFASSDAGKAIASGAGFSPPGADPKY